MVTLCLRTRPCNNRGGQWRVPEPRWEPASLDRPSPKTRADDKYSSSCNKDRGQQSGSAEKGSVRSRQERSNQCAPAQEKVANGNADHCEETRPNKKAAKERERCLVLKPVDERIRPWRQQSEEL
ncbi:unnamed protein product [Pleuronectes platessa]|uniref:Uncharacterized protein n=1 Tax=Pleuronectes platessa TaxID=8262 RepID=A0A9N7TXG6_PLEPL|nr:unnamed protein product [Pleuronectes platessa]